MWFSSSKPTRRAAGDRSGCRFRASAAFAIVVDEIAIYGPPQRGWGHRRRGGTLGIQKPPCRTSSLVRIVSVPSRRTIYVHRTRNLASDANLESGVFCCPAPGPLGRRCRATRDDDNTIADVQTFPPQAVRVGKNVFPLCDSEWNGRGFQGRLCGKPETLRVLNKFSATLFSASSLSTSI